ncbi:hypothetical protein CH256_12275 [Rhodococcus sp. 05-2254-6]|nr:hypothetical protein CH256_12275 [Rhodococcus sp. 05-2254-6]OZE35491.1 hypothetical protein CH259_15680 [Rhodococcus sp. 05-2254-4]OZE47920.1 hypothetical protein CH261_08275 [Rhodococcus sp. 05-2254-3]OZE49131.1 hypothetical protein CH283_16060 [Rhodococcus sp. 05-2254-2]
MCWPVPGTGAQISARSTTVGNRWIEWTCSKEGWSAAGRVSTRRAADTAEIDMAARHESNS